MVGGDFKNIFFKVRIIILFFLSLPEVGLIITLTPCQILNYVWTNRCPVKSHLGVINRIYEQEIQRFTSKSLNSYWLINVQTSKHKGNKEKSNEINGSLACHKIKKSGRRPPTPHRALSRTNGCRPKSQPLILLDFSLFPLCFEVCKFINQ